jgi:TolB protein
MKRATIGNRPKMLLALLLAAALAAGLLALVGPKPAEAAFPGANGKIAFSVYGQHGGGSFQSEVYTMNPDGTAQTKLTNNPAQDTGPAFSADGSKIVFASRRDGDYEIYVMDAVDINPADGNGDNPIKLTNNGVDDFSPAFSQDATKIAFVSERAHVAGDIYVMNAAPEDATTNVPQRLTNNQAIDDLPVFSLDGAKIFFETQRDGNNEIYVMDAVDTNADGNGDNPINLTNNPAQDVSPDLSPDKSKIAFASNRRNPSKPKYAIYTANSSDGSDVTRITRRPKRTDDRNPVFSPEGNKIAFAKRGGTFVGGGNDYNIFTMNADGTARTKLTGAAGIDFDPNWGSAP